MSASTLNDPAISFTNSGEHLCRCCLSARALSRWLAIVDDVVESLLVQLTEDALSQ